ncbi:MAG TPA: phenylalanine--tRNA ligase subunit beta [Tepidisphaeraceae bacterium]|nr:phenylalanine--tRNA ligase subunit beta [Tepidisphaeraceae bacterium]
MRTSLEWLSQYLPGPLDGQTAADALTNGGLPVEVIEQVGDDTVIDVEVTSNRPDCLSHLGVARELSALLNREFQDLIISELPGDGPTGVTALAIDAPDLCPHYTARIIRNVTIAPSPAWMVRRLEAVGLRPINNIVDVTNYVLFELGQPLHAFDFDKIDGRQIVVRRAKPGEKIVSIDGHERTLTPNMLVIADASRPVALAGVMGGRDTEVSGATVNILLESARFDPLSVRGTARALAMASDSSYRFERGIDPTLPERASRRATQLILETAGGEIAGPLLAAGASGYSPKQLWLRLARLTQVLGTEFPTQIVVDAFIRLRLSPVLRGERIDVTIPSHRLDLNLEIDLIEEAARVVGYDKVPVRDEISIRLAPPNLLLKASETIRNTLVAGGYFEAVTFSFVSDALANAFVPPEAGSLPRADARVRKADASLRPSILPGLLEAIRRNESNGVAGAKLFEIGSTFWNDKAGQLQEHRRVALVGGTDYRDARGVIETLLLELDADRAIRITPADRPGYARGACGKIEWGSESIGYIGKIDRAVADQLSLRELPLAAELDLAPLLSGAQHVPQLHALPRYPAVRRDLSLVLPETTRYEQLESTVRAAKLTDLEAIEYVTTYRGKPLDAGHKSVTITLIFRSTTTTLTSEAVEDAVQRVVNAAKQTLGGTLRT